jgi:hypothetical protein
MPNCWEIRSGTWATLPEGLPGRRGWPGGLPSQLGGQGAEGWNRRGTRRRGRWC